MDQYSQLRVWRTARTLKRLRAGVKGANVRRAALPAVFFVTDPDRTPDPLAIAERLPRGTGVIFRGFGRPGAEAIAAALARAARARGLVLLIGEDGVLASRVGAAGVHLPQRAASSVRGVRALNPHWIVTVAAHSPMALARARANGADAALYSTIFSSRSASARAAMGPVRLGLALTGVRLPVFALGGVNARTASRLIGTGVAGFAAVDAFGA